jgi:epoxyqueuosine reductase
MRKKSLTQLIKSKAHRQGFQLVGVTTPAPPPHLETFSKWLNKGFHAGMTWMATERAIERRYNPLKILPGCKSVLVMGIRYPTPDSSKEGKTGRVASYAWGDDYHNILPKRLKRIVSFIQEQTGEEIPNRWYTDTGPILERELAQRAGLGWIGKNSCLINPKQGSYFLLAEIFLGVELKVDRPFTRDFCGSCTRCVEACPTACITSERTIDSNRCISYLTIEHKGYIPNKYRNFMGNWIFGCDICQQVCPWNQKFSAPDHEAAFSPRLGVSTVDLKEEITLTPQKYNHKFKNSPIKRTKRRGYLRNVAIALGNQGSSSVLPALSEAMGDVEPLIRGHAAWALGQIGGDKAKGILVSASEKEENSQVMEEITHALARA